MKYAHCYNIGLVEYAKKQFFQALQKHGD